jgi:hypothetical protein
MGEQVHEFHRMVIAEDHHRLAIPRIDLREKLTTPPAGSEDAIISDGDDRFDLGLACLDHVCGGGVLGAESETAAQVDANSRVDRAGRSADRGSDGRRVVIGAS